MARKKKVDSMPPPVEKDSEAPAEEPKKPVPAWRAGLDFVVMMAGAIVIALLIKAYAFDVYLIPSGSMETALHGRPDGGDRIFCSKLNFLFRQPKRWEVAVFEFPYETARLSDKYRISEQYKGQNFVKRVVGLPGEALAIGKGDIWARREGSSEYQRQVKPDSVQRGMWLAVYDEDFGDLYRNELNIFWNVMGGEAKLSHGGPLILSAREQAVRMEYRPLAPVGRDSLQLVELPGVPDRYILEQPVQFRCTHRGDDGAVCGHLFVASTHTQNIQARCPKCGTLQDETAAVFYHRRSGLTAAGRYAVLPKLAPQGEEVPPRQADYHFVPDLRLTTTFSLDNPDARFTVTFREDSRFVQAIVHGNGQVEVEVNGEDSRPEHRTLATINPGKTHTLECYILEGTLRLFLDGGAEPLLDLAIWRDRRPLPRNLVKGSGVEVGAAGGEVAIRRLTIDRDIFYYSGWEHERGERFEQVSSQGEVFINRDCFFPMGDHCPSSFDARSWGPVPLDLLRGPALLVWWPPERFGVIPSP